MEIALEDFNIIITKVMERYGFDDQINNAIEYANRLLDKKDEVKYDAL